ncbi:hypothetical protein DVK85_06685 [Flavobacterium arcticum]|uniref:PKD domain-containing protein n=1 Tax=Flavobacterium arcticum TaxID=1784713 RepID=A0A345HBI6_9FLAO|nr:hypothetical protein [Flavobacterium arcticum]AXG73946.1 hypothetical protein DVK85_06685 [Flavobacterium arcticum]KAF2508922.1 hypothetical protein E0W72_10170 [Flavobacterium arcticum]
MITPLSNIKPFINFGFGTTSKQAATGETVTIWLDTIYNQKAYTFNTNAQDATITKISNYEYHLTYTQPGNYQVSLTANTIDKTTSLESNILTLTVV